MLISGLGAFDANGQQAETDVKYKAIALFNESWTITFRFLKAIPT
ncbi:hypothetical protein ACM9HO_07625 [Pseudomonas sp. KHB2.9]|nr:hypothetical protein [Pseudomonas sp.]